MNSFITLIVSKKTSHLRELVVNQKIKSRPKRNTSSVRSANYQLLKPDDKKSHDKSARGYDDVNIKYHNSKSHGTVTKNLKSCIENLCKTEVSFIRSFTIMTVVIFSLHIFLLVFSVFVLES